MYGIIFMVVGMILGLLGSLPFMWLAWYHAEQERLARLPKINCVFGIFAFSVYEVTEALRAFGKAINEALNHE